MPEIKICGLTRLEEADYVAEAGADYAVSITGIAGPGGGTKEKPVGLVYIGCGRKHHVVVKQYQFSGDRTQIRESSVENALHQLWEMLTEDINQKDR